MTFLQIIPLIVLGAVITGALIHEAHDKKLINKAADIMGVPKDLVPYFHCELLSIYSHQPQLKQEKDKLIFWNSVALGDYNLYAKIQAKQDKLLDQLEEYGDIFPQSSILV